MVGESASPHFHKWWGFLAALGVPADIIKWHYSPGLIADTDYPNCAIRDDIVPGPHNKSRPFRSLAGVLRTRRWLIRRNVRYLNIHQPDCVNATLALLFSGDVIITCWGSDILVNFDLAKGWRRALITAALRRAAAITFDSEAVRARLLERVPDLKPGALHLVYWGVDAECYRAPTAEERRQARIRLGLPPQAIILLSVRGPSERYRVREIIARFRTGLPGDDFRLLVHAIPGRNSAYLAQCRADAAGDPRIVFHEAMSTPEELRGLYWASDLNVHFPTTDATPVSMLEGLACGNGVLGGLDIPAYHELARVYQLSLVNLDKLDEHTVRAALVSRDAHAGANREAFLRTHSQSRSVQALGRVLGGLGEQAHGRKSERALAVTRP